MTEEEAEIRRQFLTHKARSPTHGMARISFTLSMQSGDDSTDSANFDGLFANGDGVLKQAYVSDGAAFNVNEDMQVFKPPA